jgi:hypothetical protein
MNWRDMIKLLCNYSLKLQLRLIKNLWDHFICIIRNLKISSLRGNKKEVVEAKAVQVNQQLIKTKEILQLFNLKRDPDKHKALHKISSSRELKVLVVQLVIIQLQLSIQKITEVSYLMGLVLEIRVLHHHLNL